MTIADIAVPYLGTLFGSCAKCCTAETDGDLCGACNEKLAILVRFGEEARSVEDGAADRLRELAVKVGLPDDCTPEEIAVYLDLIIDVQRDEIDRLRGEKP